MYNNTTASNSEEICRDFQDHNDNTAENETRKLKVGSMDVKNLYPSITIKLAMRAVRKAVRKTKVKMKNIDIATLIKYVAVTADKKTIEREEI